MLETDRLIIIPLTLAQLRKYMRSDSSLEKELGVNHSPRTISAELLEALEMTIIPGVEVNEKDYLYYTLWTIIWKEENKMVGDLCFFGVPNENGEIEIGYGTYEGFRKRGLMTEAVGAVIKWAEEQPGIRDIIAGTEKSNTDSYAILERNKFIKYDESETLFNWRLNIVRH
jgi:RimJ/RimL family protein N-acetyltransferase